MRCPSCGQENPDNAGFCSECGNLLANEVSCPDCGRGNLTTAKFCHGCGQRLADQAPTPRTQTPPHLAEKILRDRVGLEGERRTVTVLFSDAVGFTPLSESLGEERVYELVQECTRRMVDAVHRYEGTVTQFGGGCRRRQPVTVAR